MEIGPNVRHTAAAALTDGHWQTCVAISTPYIKVIFQMTGDTTLTAVMFMSKEQVQVYMSGSTVYGLQQYTRCKQQSVTEVGLASLHDDVNSVSFNCPQWTLTVTFAKQDVMSSGNICEVYIAEE